VVGGCPLSWPSRHPTLTHTMNEEEDDDVDDDFW